MRDYSVGDFDREIIGGVAYLRHENESQEPSYAARASATETKTTRQPAVVAYVRSFFVIFSKAVVTGFDEKRVLEFACLR
jgi:hypothetical protein